MADKIDCKAAMVEHWQRLGWDFKHLLWDFKNGNPYHKKNRKAYADIHHAIVNIPVEFCRACPYTAGHWWFYHMIATVGLLFLL